MRQLQDSENILTVINHQLKDKVNLLQHSNDDLRKKVALIKEAAQEKESIGHELALLKEKLATTQLERDRLEDEKKKIIEISIEDKMSLEEHIGKL